jgi:hypothetical protein
MTFAPLRSVIPASLAWALLVAGCGDEATDLPDGAVLPPADTGAAPQPDAGSTTPDADSPDVLPREAGTPALYGDQPFTIGILPDTQFYIQSYPDMFMSQVNWFAQEKENLKLAFVLHEGDVVETPSFPNQWALADGVLGVLDMAKIPFVLCAGNHDIGWNATERLATLMNQTFPTSRFPHYQGSFEANKIENSYYLLPAGGKTWLIVALEFGPRNEAVAWADGIFKMHADKPAILLTHAYMYMGMERYDHVKFPEGKHFWNPHVYRLPGSTNDGEEMWQKLVSKNDNILLVFSGHATWPEGAAGLLSTRRANGYYVHEMLANFQGCPVDDNMCVNRDTNRRVRGGEGTLRTISFEPANRRALVKTYSPYLKQSRVETNHQFELPLE